MITKYQANLENNHVRGINNYTPPTYTYIGLSTVAIDDSGALPENAEPDASTGYARIRVVPPNHQSPQLIIRCKYMVVVYNCEFL